MQDDDDWEHQHDYIQWMFPTDEVSLFNDDAPILFIRTISEIHHSTRARINIITSSHLFDAFLARRYGVKGAQKLMDGDHNCLRVTRVLKCMRLLLPEHTELRERFYDKVYNLSDVEIADKYWRSAMGYAPRIPDVALT